MYGFFHSTSIEQKKIKQLTTALIFTICSTSTKLSACPGRISAQEKMGNHKFVWWFSYLIRCVMLRLSSFRYAELFGFKGYNKHWGVKGLQWSTRTKGHYFQKKANRVEQPNEAHWEIWGTSKVRCMNKHALTSVQIFCSHILTRYLSVGHSLIGKVRIPGGVEFFRRLQSLNVPGQFGAIVVVWQ